MRLSAIALALAVVSTVLARIYITTPVAATVWKAGERVTIVWQGHLAEASKANLRLRKSGDHFVIVYEIDTVRPGTNCLELTLGPDLKSDFYAIEIGGVYSHAFKIEGGAAKNSTTSDSSVSLTLVSVVVAIAAVVVI